MAEVSCAEPAPKLPVVPLCWMRELTVLSAGAYVTHLANDLLVLRLTGSLISNACHCLAGAYGCCMEKARGLGRRHTVLICVYFEYDNMNKHRSSLGGYWLSVFLTHHFSAINT